MQCMDWILDQKRTLKKKKTGETPNKVDILFNSTVQMLIS